MPESRQIVFRISVWKEFWEMLGTYLVAVSAMLFAAASALTLIYAVEHLDPPPVPPSAEQKTVASAVVGGVAV